MHKVMQRYQNKIPTHCDDIPDASKSMMSDEELAEQAMKREDAWGFCVQHKIVHPFFSTWKAHCASMSHDQFPDYSFFRRMIQYHAPPCPPVSIRETLKGFCSKEEGLEGDDLSAFPNKKQRISSHHQDQGVAAVSVGDMKKQRIRLMHKQREE